MLKLFVATDDERILGCHAYGAHSADIVQEVAALMCRDTTIPQLRDIIHIHPTLGEILKAATE
jgi:dihydrolipoamide dehydrogenase